MRKERFQVAAYIVVFVFFYYFYYYYCCTTSTSRGWWAYLYMRTLPIPTTFLSLVCVYVTCDERARDEWLVR